MLANVKIKLKDHYANKPIRPRRMILRMRDTTPEAIAVHLHSVWPSAGLTSDEGGQILNGRAASQLPLFNELWSGGELIVNRKDSESFSVAGARLSLSVMVQEKTFQKFFSTRGDLARDNGLLARCLMAYPPSTQGMREDWSIEPAKWPHLEGFHKRITEILEIAKISEGEPGFQRTILDFSPDAKTFWVGFANHIERNLNPGGMYADVRDAASKIAENAGRMAALFHLFEGRTGDIQRDSVESACQLCEWYLVEFRRIFHQPPPIPQSQLDAMALDLWLRNIFHTCGQFMTKRNFVRQSGPSQLRNKARLEAAIAALGFAGRIRMVQCPNSNTWFVELLVHSSPYQVCQ